MQESRVMQQTLLASEYYSEKCLGADTEITWALNCLSKLEIVLFADSILDDHCGVASDMTGVHAVL